VTKQAPNSCWRVFAVLLSFTSSLAKDIYIAQMERGGGWGTNAACARSMAWFNAGANWGPGASKLSVGDTVHLVGTITNAVIPQLSGTSGSPITLLFEPKARIAMPAIPASGGIKCTGRSYLTIDGGVDGLIESTDNGTGRGHQVNSIGVNWEGSQIPMREIIIQKLTIRNLYVREANSNDTNYGGKGIYVTGSLSNLSIRCCTISQCNRAILIGYSSGASYGLRCYSNEVSHCNWGVGVGDCQHTAMLHNLSIRRNRINLFDDWEDPGNRFHHDGIFAYVSSAGSYITNITICDNVIGPYFGKNITAAIYISSARPDGIRHTVIYNNVLFTSTNKAPSCGFIGARNLNGACVSNNTMDANGHGGIGVLLNHGANISIVNNIIAGVANPVCEETSRCITKCDYNNYHYSIIQLHFSTAGQRRSYSNWRRAGFDEHSVIGDPGYAGSAAFNFRLNSGSVAIDAGNDQSAWFTTDISGANRPQGRAWDIGAYEYSHR